MVKLDFLLAAVRRGRRQIGCASRCGSESGVMVPVMVRNCVKCCCYSRLVQLIREVVEPKEGLCGDDGGSHNPWVAGSSPGRASSASQPTSYEVLPL